MKRSLFYTLVYIVLILAPCNLLAGCKNNAATSKKTQENEIIWAFPAMDLDDTWGENIDSGFMDERERLLNEKLHKDGFDYTVKFLIISGREYRSKLPDLVADIANVGGISVEVADDPVERLFTSGVFACLDNYVTDCRLKKIIPEVAWERARFNGKFYCLPQVVNMSTQSHITFNSEKISIEKVREFNGDLNSLMTILGNDAMIWIAPQWPTMFKYLGYFDKDGVLYDSDGNIINPFTDEKCIKMSETFDSLYDDGHLITDSKKRKDCEAVFGFTNRISNLKNEFYYFSQPWVTITNYGLNLGILEKSEKKEAAFELLDIVLSDPAYGNILVWENENPQTGGSIDSRAYMRERFSWYDLIYEPEGYPNYFATVEERNEFYKNIVLYPRIDVSKCDEVKTLKDTAKKYGDLLYFDDAKAVRLYGSVEKYRQELAETKSELKELYEIIIQKVYGKNK